jgi:prepilin peptidase CpaA
MLRQLLWPLATVLAVAAGWTDWRWRRIPNWLTVPGLLVGMAVQLAGWGWPGLRESLLGAALGLALLLPFVLIKALGGGDWKLVGATGAYAGPSNLLTILVVAIFVNAAMALGMVIWKGRLRQTARNMGRILASFFTLHLPGQDLTLDNPELVKVPFGVAFAVAVLLFFVRHVWGV